ncbi:hypothetical protein QE152_g40323 [Popillia japonica]|uniref:Uncharacterized protein n=1 Tax=Popillia japonica TaxID=7064 RepID=A0AAW1HRT6_POPJA
MTYEETQKELQKLWQEFLSDEEVVADPFDNSSGDEYIPDLLDSGTDSELPSKEKAKGTKGRREIEVDCEASTSSGYQMMKNPLVF